VNKKTTNRAGFTLVELIATTVLLGAVMMSAAPLLGWISVVQRSSMQRQLALQEATNILERMSAQPWETITDETALAVTLSENTRHHLKQPKLTITVTNIETPLPAKRINLSLTWKNHADDFWAPVRLTTWVYQHKESP